MFFFFGQVRKETLLHLFHLPKARNANAVIFAHFPNPLKRLVTGFISPTEMRKKQYHKRATCSYRRDAERE